MKLRGFAPVIQGQALFLPLDLDLVPGTITAVLGPSGVGKSSLINAIRGQIPHTGTMQADGEIFTVFQDLYQLFPWFTVRQNLDLAVGDDSYLNLCKAWGVSDLLDHHPGQVSGGQRQRFTLIRACCARARYLLCDEALSGLDMLTSETVAQDLRSWITTHEIGCIFVTHNWHEARRAADHIVVLKPDAVYHLPVDITEHELYTYLV